MEACLSIEYEKRIPVGQKAHGDPVFLETYKHAIPITELMKCYVDLFPVTRG